MFFHYLCKPKLSFIEDYIKWVKTSWIEDPTAEKSAPGPILQENRIQIRYVEVTASLFWIEAYSLTH